MSDQTSNKKGEGSRKDQLSTASDLSPTFSDHPGHAGYTPSTGTAKKELTKDEMDKLIDPALPSIWQGKRVLHPDRIPRVEENIPLNPKHKSKAGAKTNPPRKDAEGEDNGFVVVDEARDDKDDKFVVVDKPASRKRSLEESQDGESVEER